MNDKQRIDWLEYKVRHGSCPGLINDDNGHWALVFDGFQSVACGSKPVDVQTTFFVKAKDWRPTIRKAIDAVMAKDKTPTP